MNIIFNNSKKPSLTFKNLYNKFLRNTYKMVNNIQTFSDKCSVITYTDKIQINNFFIHYKVENFKLIDLSKYDDINIKDLDRVLFSIYCLIHDLFSENQIKTYFNIDYNLNNSLFYNRVNQYFDILDNFYDESYLFHLFGGDTYHKSFLISKNNKIISIKKNNKVKSLKDLAFYKLSTNEIYFLKKLVF